VRFFIVPATEFGVMVEADTPQDAVEAAAITSVGEFVVVADEDLPRFRVTETLVRDVEAV
jgi:hypothetical protein